jgi:glycosyltransferase involved in cell wall biosynthesis
MRRPQCGQSLRSFCASWSHQLQTRRFSTDQGSEERDGATGSTWPTISIGSPVSRSRYTWPASAGSSTSRPVDGVRKRYSWRELIGEEPSNGPGARGTEGDVTLAAVRVLIFHGYLLHGTGSNVYNAELGQAFVRAGHELHLLCQDRAPLELPWVDATGDWDAGALELTARRQPPRATVYRPDLGGLLPVYVADRYEGVEARPFQDLSEAEVSAYVERNAAAVAEVVARARPDVALANHLVMGPLILARALAGTGVPYAVKIHGSALEYTVKRHPRFLPAARAGLAGASGVLVGSRHTAESLWAALDEPGLEEKTRLGPPGVDVTRFAPRSADDAAAGLERLRARLEAAAREERAPDPAGLASSGPGSSGPASSPAASSGPGSSGPASSGPGSSGPGSSGPGSSGPGSSGPGSSGAGSSGPGSSPPVPSGSSFARSPAEAAAALAAVDPRRDRVVAYVGKLIASKGVELLLAAWPLVLARVPRARLLVVGFGAFRPALEGLAGALARGDLEAARALRAEDGRELPELAAFLDALGPDAAGYRAAARGLAGTVRWAGRLDHAELTDVLPAVDAMAMPSTFPESFGMVAAEAAACGALPVVAGHSGMAEVARALAAVAPPQVRPWLTFAVGPRAVTQLADGLASWLEAPAGLRASTRDAIVRVARERYSWEGVARTVVAAAEGRLEELPRP